MKLKVLPPTLRKNNRYLTLDIKIVSPIKKDDLVNIVWDSCLHFHGELMTSNFNLWIMRFFYIEKTNEYYRYKAIIRCQREFTNEVRCALALSNMYSNYRISITTIALSGTINASLKYI